MSNSTRIFALSLFEWNVTVNNNTLNFEKNSQIHQAFITKQIRSTLLKRKKQKTFNNAERYKFDIESALFRVFYFWICIAGGGEGLMR